MLGTYDFFSSESSYSHIINYLKKELNIREKRPLWQREFDEYRKLVLKRNSFTKQQRTTWRNNQKAQLLNISEAIDDIFMLTNINQHQGQNLVQAVK